MKKSFECLKLNIYKTISGATLPLFLLFWLIPFSLKGGEISGTFVSLASCPMNLTCFTVDPTTGYFYGQGDRSTNYYRYNAATNAWSTLAASPQTSGNNGGATYLNGKIYNSYCSYDVVTVYTIATNTWTTIAGGLNSGSISTDGTDIYVSANNSFKKYVVSTSTWVTLTGTTCQPWGGLRYKSGYFYLHEGNGTTGFKRYHVATDTWTALTSVPGGAVLGSAIYDAYYYCQGSYGGTNLYSYDLGAGEWNNILTLPFTTNDAAIVTYVNSLYIVQGEAGTGFTRFTPNNPMLTNMEGTALSYTFGDAAINITASLTASQNAGTNFQSATVSITGNFEAGKDVLSFVDAYGITGSWNSTTGVLALTGTTTIANYQAALRTVKYSNTDITSGTNTRTISFKVYDGSIYSNTASRNITIPGPPAVTTTAISSISGTTASSGGVVSEDGSSSVTARGVCFNTAGTPTLADNHTTNGTGLGSFTSSLTGLTIGATYYVRAYATNALGTAYGTVLSFTAGLCIPSVSANACSNMYITNVTTTGGMTNFNNTTACAPSSYTNYSPTHAASQAAGGSVTMSFTSYAYALNYAVWIDFNDDGTFDAGEKVVSFSNSGLTGSTSFVVPADAPLGTHRMRIMGEYNGNGIPDNPCSALVYGETEDYAFTVSNPAPANPTSVTASENTICSGSGTQLTANGAIGTVYWYTGSCGGTPVTTGNPITVSPASTTTYYARNYDNSAFSTGCASTAITVNPVSAGGTIDGTETIAYGSSTGTLTLSSYTGAILKWQRKLNSGIWKDTSNISATHSEIPGSFGTWYFRAVVKNGTCPETNSAEFSVTVNKKVLTISGAIVASKTYDGNTDAIITGATLTGVIGTDDVVLGNHTSGNFVQASVGTGISVNTAMTITGTASGNYILTQPILNANISLKTITISGAIAADKEYDGTSAAAVSGATLNDTIGSDVVNLENSGSGTFASVSVGTGITVTTAMTLSGADSGNYSLLQPPLTADITPRELMATADSTSKIFGDSNPAFTVSYSGFVNEENESVLDTKPVASSTATDSTNAGVVAITLSGGSDNNYSFGYTDGILTITKATLVVTVDNKSKIYGEANPVLTIGYNGFVNGNDEDVIDTIPHVSTDALNSSNAGTYTITADGGMDNNYSFSYFSGSLTIGKAALMVTADSITKSYGDANPDLTYTYYGFVNSDEPSVIDLNPVIMTTADELSDVGFYPIVLTGGSDNNYELTRTDGEISVGKATITAAADNKGKIYGESNPALTISYSGFKNSEDTAAIDSPPVASTPATDSSDAGSYPVILSAATDNNYDITNVDGILTIGKVTLTVTADDKSRIYGEANPVLTFSYNGFVFGNDEEVLDTIPTASTDAIASSNTGTYTITTNEGADNNYNFISVDGSLAVTKAMLTITAADKSRKYGEANPALTCAYSGLKNNDDESVLDILPDMTTSAVGTTPPGSIPIILNGGSDNNYDFTLADGVMTINKTALVVSSDNKTKVYGQDNPPLTISYEGFVNDEDPSALLQSPQIQVNAGNNSDAGVFTIVLSGASSDNYEIVYSEGNLTVEKAPLQVTAESVSKAYLEEVPALTVTYSGFVYDESQDVLDVMAIALTDASQNSDAGDYDITASGGSDNNYDYIYNNGLLTILKADQVITFDDIPEGLRTTQVYQLVASSASGLPVSFGSSQSDIVTISGADMTVEKEGTTQIMASQEGDHNWNPAADVLQTIVTRPTFDNIRSLFTPNSDGMNDYWYIADIGQYGQISVKIYNRFGTLLYESPAYNNDWDGTYNGTPLPSASYYYIIKSSEKGIIKGVVNLVR
jgi:gliding motility-associated-like protein